MHAIKYSRARLSVFLVLVALFAWAGAWGWAVFEGRGAFAGGLIAIVMACLIPYALRYILMDNTIVEIGDAELRYHGLFGTKRMRYDRLTELSIETHTTSGIFKQRHLIIGEEGGYFAKARISERFLASDFRPLENIIEMIAEGPRTAHHTEVRPATRRTENAAPAPHSSAPQPQGFGRKGL